MSHASTGSISANYLADVRGSSGASLALRGAARGRYVTWRAGSDSDFVLSYVSASGGVEHVRLGRNADGSWLLADADAGSRASYPTLPALVGSRLSLDFSA